MSKFASIYIVFKDGEHPDVSIQRPSGFGVNEFGFFCVETDTKLQMYPAALIMSIEVNKSQIVAVS